MSGCCIPQKSRQSPRSLQRRETCHLSNEACFQDTPEDSTNVKLLFLTSGRYAPASRFRVLQFVPWLERAGHRCTVWPSRPAKYESYWWLGWRLSQQHRRWRRWLDLFRIRRSGFDVIVIERELFDDPDFTLERRLREVARALVLDVDDAIHLRYPEKFAALASLADVVLAGNPLLCDVARNWNQHVHLLPTCIDSDRYPVLERPVEPSRLPVIGWTGTSSNLPYLNELAPVLRRLHDEIPFEFHLITNSAHAAAFDPGFPVTRIEWREDNELTELARFDIGLMPLPDDEWSRHKCGLKILQYFGVAIPVVASPVGVNRDIVRASEGGFLATSPDEWESALRTLLTVPVLRRQYGLAGRHFVEQHYSVRSQLRRLIAALNDAVAVGQSRGRSATPHSAQ